MKNKINKSHLIFIIIFLYIPCGIFVYYANFIPLNLDNTNTYIVKIGYELWQYVFGLFSISATYFLIKDKRLL
jgi:hypothetical protein